MLQSRQSIAWRGFAPRGGRAGRVGAVGFISLDTARFRGAATSWAAGTTFRAPLYGQQIGKEPVRASFRVAGDVIKEFDVKATDRENPDVNEATVRLRMGTSRVAVGFLNPDTDTKIKDKEKQRRMLYVRRI